MVRPKIIAPLRKFWRLSRSLVGKVRRRQYHYWEFIREVYAGQQSSKKGLWKAHLYNIEAMGSCKSTGLGWLQLGICRWVGCWRTRQRYQGTAFFLDGATYIITDFWIHPKDVFTVDNWARQFSINHLYERVMSWATLRIIPANRSSENDNFTAPDSFVQNELMWGANKLMPSSEGTTLQTQTEGGSCQWSYLASLCKRKRLWKIHSYEP